MISCSNKRNHTDIFSTPHFDQRVPIILPHRIQKINRRYLHWSTVSRNSLTSRKTSSISFSVLTLSNSSKVDISFSLFVMLSLCFCFSITGEPLYKSNSARSNKVFEVTNSINRSPIRLPLETLSSKELYKKTRTFLCPCEILCFCPVNAVKKHSNHPKGTVYLNAAPSGYKTAPVLYPKNVVL